MPTLVGGTGPDGPITNYPNGVSSFGIPLYGSGGIANPFGSPPAVFVNTDTAVGNDGNDGASPDTPYLTMAKALDNIDSNGVINFIGTIREQLTAPLGVYGVTIQGLAGGGVRDDNGAKWTYPASGAVAGGALLLLREQGWVLNNFLMTPEPTSGACIELRRAEDATYPDASHFIANGMRFVGIDVTTTYGIRDIGGCSNVEVNNCEFYLCTTGYWCSSTSIANPLRNKMYGNRFLACTNDLIRPSTLCLHQGNKHFNTAATEKVEISGGAGENIVTENVFPDVAADINPGNGYDGEASDFWTNNWASDAVVFGNPA